MVLFAALATRCGAATPCILITNLPAYGTTNHLAGVVLNAGPATNAVAVFIYVPGYGWVTKPTCAQPLTTIQTNGSWSANIKTGAGDIYATRVAALLVATNYNQPCVDGLANLPTNIYDRAVAKTVITRPSPGVRFLNFSGYDWAVKNSAGLVGPGPNYFSDSASNAWTDTNGWLHLRITHRSNQWQCAEIVSARTFGPGSYRMELNSDVNALNANVTLGMFTWSDDPAYADREIDVECARWGWAGDTDNSQFVVQPYDAANHLVRYRTPAGQANSTHLFVWRTNRVDYQALRGSYAASPAATNIIATWAFTNPAAVPRSGDENMRFNLWLFQGSAPTDTNEAEVVVKNFNHVPPEAAPPATLGKFSLPAAGPFQCEWQVRPDYRYEVQTSSNLLHWAGLAAFLATNATVNFTDASPLAAGGRFYRVVTQP